MHRVAHKIMILCCRVTLILFVYLFFNCQLLRMFCHFLWLNKDIDCPFVWLFFNKINKHKIKITCWNCYYSCGSTLVVQERSSIAATYQCYDFFGINNKMDAAIKRKVSTNFLLQKILFNLRGSNGIFS